MTSELEARREFRGRLRRMTDVETATTDMKYSVIYFINTVVLISIGFLLFCCLSGPDSGIFEREG